ncbi:MAG: 16S rRNA (cytosine(967)-C(5))-methyltransferase RsmB, partial [Clostridia bacterium]|nr:16S rRNA (cytosine(967)-C(5))-methyltransferase RsmB [Clostridia bacterium]
FSVRTKAHDGTTADAALASKADCVICDVPCSGMGVLGKKPDMRYKSAESFSALPPLQSQILEQAFTYLKEGGRLLYATCTVLKEENEGVVNAFLEAHRDAHLVPFAIGGLEAENGMLTLYPHRHQTDGFFIALLERI